jgi:hypothetical protein
MSVLAFPDVRAVAALVLAARMLALQVVGDRSA